MSVLCEHIKVGSYYSLKMPSLSGHDRCYARVMEIEALHPQGRIAAMRGQVADIEAANGPFVRGGSTDMLVMQEIDLISEEELRLLIVSPSQLHEQRPSPSEYHQSRMKIMDRHRAHTKTLTDASADSYAALKRLARDKGLYVSGTDQYTGKRPRFVLERGTGVDRSLPARMVSPEKSIVELPTAVLVELLEELDQLRS